MAVNVACSGTLRWHALGRATGLLCPLHRRQLAALPFLGTPNRATVSRLRSRAPSRQLPSDETPSPTTAQTRRLITASPAGYIASKPPKRNHQSLSRCTRPVVITTAHHAAALIAATTTSSPISASIGLPPAAIALINLLPSIGAFLLCLAAAVLLLASVPAVWALARAAHQAERLMAAMESELPDTAASMRLAGLELTDCVQELGALGGELTRGVRSTAALVTAAEAGVRGGVTAADSAVRNHVLPAMAKVERDTRGVVEQHLITTAKLSYTRPLVAQAVATARRFRTVLAVGRLAGAAVQAGHAARDALTQREAPYKQRLDEQLTQLDEPALRRQLEALQNKHRKQNLEQHDDPDRKK
ncbi:hypothetical protein Vafri_19788 [Volvox africanus]|uniref:Uncharacterized protein n=1 Tax=Volvox africanus TaxID=51714 RepID=A0A8J4BS93_9CHLO|nr:hypothetical protein Vafri_19788 [Volvox africanus]